MRQAPAEFVVAVSSVGAGSGTHSSTLAWRIPGTEEPGGLQSMGSRRVRHDWATSLSLFTFMRWRRKWQPTPVLLPGESQGRGSLVGCRLWGREESDTTEPLPYHFSLACIGEGNGSPLQCSFLESPRDGGAWRAAVCGVARSRARLQRLSSSSSGVISAMSVHCQLFKHYWIHCGLARSIWEPDFSCGHMPSSVLYFLTEGNYIEIIFLLEFF